LHWAHFVVFFASVLLYVIIEKELTRILRRKKWQTSVEKPVEVLELLEAVKKSWCPGIVDEYIPEFKDFER